MPKKNHRRGGAGENKHIGGFDEVKRRNENDGKDLPKGKGKGKAEDEWESSSGDEEEQKPQEVKPKKKDKGEAGDEPKEAKEAKESKPPKEKKPAAEDEFAPIGAEKKPEGMELSRKQREEMQKEAARRRYEELHKAGKTDEAKADLARLAEVKKRREEATKKKADEEAAEKEKKAGKSKDASAKAEMKELLGGEAAKLRGARSSLKKQESGVEVGGETPGDGLHKRGVEPPELYTSFRVEGTSAPVKNTANQGKVKDGSIHACRAAEDDFM